MIDKIFESTAAALEGVRDGATVMIGGFGGAGQPGELIDALIAQGARDLTIVNNNAGNGETGLAALLKAGRVKKIICSFPRQVDSQVFDGLYRSGDLELELVPQGNLAERIRAAGAAVVQINTGTGCHLDADMTARGMRQLDPPRGAMLLIENVGNLVCPALFDLGEQAKVVILSVTEGEDKPIKYPHMFRACQMMLLNKVDLLPHLRFDVDRCIAYARQVNPEITVLQVSAQDGKGMEAWYDWLRGQGSSVR